MARDSLMQRLLAARRCRCVVLQAPAGSGKTSTLLAWRQALLTLNYSVAWVSLSSAENDQTLFFECLLSALGEVDATAVRKAALLTGRNDDQTATEHRVIALVQGLADLTRPLLLVLDDLHHLEDIRVIQILQWLVDYAPPRLHIAFASRRPLPHPLSSSLARLCEQNLATWFDLRDLRFSAEESERYLRERLGRIEAGDALTLHRTTDGWVAGLELLAIEFKARKDEAYVPVPLRDAQAIAHYFESEVLARVQPEDLKLLTHVAICEQFCLSLCTALLDQPNAFSRILKCLLQLDSSNLFVAEQQGPSLEAWYRLHPLLHEVLLSRLTALGPEEQQALHRRAWHWCNANGHVDEAVRHAVSANEADVAAEIVESCSRDLLTRGEFGRLMTLMGRLPQQQVEAKVSLRMVMAHIHLYSRELNAMAKDIAALECYPLDEPRRAELALLHAGLALQHDDVDEAMRVLPALDSWPDDQSEFLRLARTNLFAWMHIARGEFALARAVLEQGSVRQGGLAASLMARCMAGLSHALEGRMVEAERLYREVLNDAEQQGAAFVGVSNMAAALLGDVLYEMDEVESACQLLDVRIDLIEHLAIPEAMLRTAIVLASGHWVSGRRLEAMAQLDRLEDYAIANRLDRLQAHALLLRVRFAQRQGDSQAAMDALARLEAIADRHPVAVDAVSLEIGQAFGRAQVTTMLHRGDWNAAASMLYVLAEKAEAAGRLRPVAAMRLQLALIEQRLGRPAVAASMLVDALRLAHRLGLVRTVLDASRRIPDALVELQQQGGLDPVLSYYVERLVQVACRMRVAAQGVHVPAPLSSTAEPLKEREREILGLLAQALPSKKIARVIGLSPETVKWHLKNIYAKLGVSARDEAVARARDLGL